VCSLSIVIPAYNEAKRLPATLDRILSYLAAEGADATTEILVVDDGSTDGTAALVREYGARHRCIRLLSNPGNRGKGFAVRHGMLAAENEWVLFTDADLSAPIEEFETLLKAAKDSGAAVAIGSRALDRRLIEVHQAAMRELSGRVFNAFMRFCTGLKIYDTQCGFKLYRRDAAREIFRRQLLDGFSFDVEDAVIAQQVNIRLIEVPVRWSNVEGTKVAFSNGLRAFLDVLQIRWNSICGRYR
jgi:dolichyl-phosphate beta-glucosyltransferase